MIRLTLHAKSEPEIHLFNKSVIVIGSEHSPDVDIALPKLNLQPVHIKIIEQDGFLILINVANDPFVTLNGHPFGKKLLKTGDIILIHDIDLLFEHLNDTQESEETDEEERSKNNLLAALDNQIHSQETVASTDPNTKHPSLLGIDFPFEHEVETLKEEEWKTSDIENYVHQIEQHNQKTQTQTLQPLTNQQAIIYPKNEEHKSISTSLKDDYLREWDDDNQISIGMQATEQNHLYHAWKWIIFFIFSVLTITGIIGTVIYLTVSDNTGAQEAKVAQGMSDIAMALMYAQLQHVKPHNQNWSDIDFIKTNLQAILPQTNSYASEIDSQGQFQCCPYSLRIYTSSDLSRFLLIAQPAPSLLHWLIPKTTVLIDSQSMEIRALKDLRTLNRLLATSNPLEGVSGKEIYQLIKQGELIRLSSLGNEHKHFDFLPPKNLAWIRAGSENLIYNAPRYYRLGQGLIQKAIALSTTKSSSQEVASLKQDMEAFTRLHNLVLYADNGKKSALLTKQGIMTFAPSDQVLFGYLVFNGQGKIHQVHLLKEDEELKESSTLVTNQNDKELVISELIALQSPEKTFKEEKTSNEDLKHPQIDTNHPIYIQLSTLIHLREKELQPLVKSLTDLLKKESRSPTHDFQTKFQEISYNYLLADQKHKEKIKEALSALYHQYDEMPINQFIELVEQVGCHQLIQHNEQTFTLISENCQQNLESIFHRIEKAKTIMELDHLIHLASIWLTFDHLKNSKDLLYYQNLLRNHVLTKLEKVILTTQDLEEFHPLSIEDKEFLEHVLNQERLIRSEEKEFFISEFNHRLEKNIPFKIDDQLDSQEISSQE